MADRLKLDLEVDRLRLIDVSSEDDCLISSPSGFLEDSVGDDCFDLFVVDDAQERDGTSDFLDQRDQESVSPLETERVRKNGKCNLRKSLAWDSAFLTDEGVLDSDELDSMNNGTKKSDRRPLPGIQEDLRISAESSSTLDSDNFTLESLDVNLFEDVRASIQRSSKAPNMASVNIKAGPGVSATKKAELAGRNKIKPVVPKRESISAQGTEKTKKEAVINIRSRVIQPTRSGELNTSSLKPPKILGRTNLISATPTKRSSLGPNRVKVENGNAKAASVAGIGGSIGLSKKPSLGGSIVITRTTGSSRLSSSSSTSAKLKATASGSPCNKSGSTSSDSPGKSPLKILRKKPDPRNVTLISGSTLKAPLRTSTKSKTESGNSRLLTYLKSVPSSSISPGSSMDGWSTESSSSTSTVNQWSNSSKVNASISSPRQGFSLDRNNLATQTEMKSRLHDPSNAKRASLGTGPLSHQASTNASKSFKPSGLRMPSPKIGFFDTEKSVVSSPNGSSQLHSGVRTGLPKPGTPKGGSAKTKPGGKLQLTRSLTGNGSIKSASHEVGLVRSASSPKPTTVVQIQESSFSTPKLSKTSRAGEKCPETHWKAGEREQVSMVGSNLDSVSNARKVVSQYALKKDNTGSGSANNITHSGEDGLHIYKELPDGYGNKIIPSIISTERNVHGQGCPENNQRSLNKGNEKENLFCVKDQVDGLSKQVAAIDLRAPDILKEAIEKKGFSLSRLDVNNLDDPGDPKLASPNSSTLLVHGQEDLQKILSKSNPLSLSPNTVNVVTNTRTPFASNLYFCNKNGSLEPASESPVEAMPSARASPEKSQKQNRQATAVHHLFSGCNIKGVYVQMMANNRNRH